MFLRICNEKIKPTLSLKIKLIYDMSRFIKMMQVFLEIRPQTVVFLMRTATVTLASVNLVLTR